MNMKVKDETRVTRDSDGTADLNAVHPPRLFSSDKDEIARDAQILGGAAPTSKTKKKLKASANPPNTVANKTAIAELKVTSTRETYKLSDSLSVDHMAYSTISDTDRMHLPKPSKGIDIVSSPYGTPAAKIRYIQTDQTELGQMHNAESSTRTPSNDIASPELVEYIKSTEKELDMLLKETLASPTSSNRNDSTEISLDSCLNDLKRDLSFHEECEGTCIYDNVDLAATETTVQIRESEYKESTKKMRSLETSAAKHRIHSLKKTRDHDRLVKKRKINHMNHQSGDALRFLIKAFLLSCVMATSFAILLGSIYPSSPLILSSDISICQSKSIEGECTTAYHSSYSAIQRFQLGLATLSFGFATSIRTIAAAPLQRLDEKFKARQIDFPFLSRVLNIYDGFADMMEKCSHDVWEYTAMYNSVLKVGATKSSPHDPPELDLGIRVPCDADRAKVYLLQKCNDMSCGSLHGECMLRDVISRELLIDYATAYFDADFDLATHPIILRNMWSKESLDEPDRKLTPSGILNDQLLSNFMLPNYFSDATKTGYAALVPDSDGVSLSQFVKSIQSGQTPNAKIGTQSIVEEFPELREEIVPLKLAKKLFGWDPLLDDLRAIAMQNVWSLLKPFVQMIPPLSYYPVFIAGSSDVQGAHSRTDLHTEPIGNIAVQLHGSRHWTLVPSNLSALLRPTVSKHGRGYIYSSLDPINELPKRLKEVPLVWEFETNPGDAVWVPPWIWHRVDYRIIGASNASDDHLSIGASVFHFYPKLYARNFPLFAFFIIPNLIWEAIGINVE